MAAALADGTFFNATDVAAAFAQVGVSQSSVSGTILASDADVSSALAPAGSGPVAASSGSSVGAGGIVGIVLAACLFAAAGSVGYCYWTGRCKHLRVRHDPSKDSIAAEDDVSAIAAVAPGPSNLAGPCLQASTERPSMPPRTLQRCVVLQLPSALLWRPSRLMAHASRLFDSVRCVLLDMRTASCAHGTASLVPRHFVLPWLHRNFHSLHCARPLCRPLSVLLWVAHDECPSRG